MVRDESPEQGAHAARRRPGRALLAKFVSADSYGLVLVLVVVTYVVSVSFVAGWAQSVVLAVQLATVWLTFRTARTPLSARVMVFVVFLAVAFVVSALLYVVAPFAVVRDIATRRSVDQEAVLGAIAAYLIVGMCFAFTYRAIGVLQPTPFFGAEGPGDMTQTLFFSFVTLTTTWYGNLVPATNPGQSLAVMEAVLGQLFLVTAVAKIITAWKPRRWRSPEDPD